MKPTLALDTGPIVALLSPSEPHHEWAKQALRVTSRVITCEAVVSEAFFLLRKSIRGHAALRGLVAQGELEIEGLSNQAPALMRLMTRYSSVPMSFADACLVRLSELTPGLVVATLDSDFHVYRRNSRQVIPLLEP